MTQYVISLTEKPDLSHLSNEQAETVGQLKQTHDRKNHEARNDLDQMNGVEVINDLWINNTIVVDVTDKRAMLRLRAMPWARRIEYNAEMNFPQDVAQSNVEPDIGHQFPWGLEAIRAPEVWDLGVTGSGITLGIGDTGIYPDHEAFDFSFFFQEFDPDTGEKIDSDPWYSHYHGTHVAGTVCGRKFSDFNPGVAKNAAMGIAMVLNNGGSFAAIAAGIQWATESPIRVYNMSLGLDGAYSDSMTSALDSARAGGTLCVCSIGNSEYGSSGGPGHNYISLGVGATSDGAPPRVANFSSGRYTSKGYWPTPVESWPDWWMVPRIAAPGQDVESAYVDSPTSTRFLDGTSMAAPHVTGTAGLVLEANPDLTVEQLKSVLMNTAHWDDRYRREPALDPRLGYGNLDALNAVKAVS